MFTITHCRAATAWQRMKRCYDRFGEHYSRYVHVPEVRDGNNELILNSGKVGCKIVEFAVREGQAGTGDRPVSYKRQI